MRIAKGRGTRCASPLFVFYRVDFVMAYEYHITRSASWDADLDPITIEEVEQMAELLPPGFQIDWEGVLEVRTPYGIETESIGPCLFYQDPYMPGERIYVRFQGEEIGRASCRERV